MAKSLHQLVKLLRANGVCRIYAKPLSANDNSKNQIYLGEGFGVLNILPHGDVYMDISERGGSIRARHKANIELFWLNDIGRHPAPAASLILYPKYPEVRMSGILIGCREAPVTIMTSRDVGRVLVLGITAHGEILAYAAQKGSGIANEILKGSYPRLGVFREIPIDPDENSSKSILLSELRRIVRTGWIPSQKLDSLGIRRPYVARNAGGYTLESQLGIRPNGLSEPDFLGWEIKQFGVNNFLSFTPKSSVTLLTPEPSGGVYNDEGVASFLRRYGYPDRAGRIGRTNFGGIYTCDAAPHPLTGLKLKVEGYDKLSGVVTNMDGAIYLIDRSERIAASWNFLSLIHHWNRKHGQAAYIPSLFQSVPPAYAFGSTVMLCEQTDFLLFLRQLCSGIVYYDPAVKMEESSTKPAIKRRSQFRIKHAELPALYHSHEYINVLDGD